MLVDDYEKYNNDRQDVVDINTDETVGDADAELLADDCTFPLSDRLIIIGLEEKFPKMSTVDQEASLEASTDNA